MAGKRQHGQGSVYRVYIRDEATGDRIPDGWMAQIRVWDEAAGKSRQIRRRAKTRDEARAILDRLNEAPPHATDLDPQMTVADYYRIWTQTTLPRLRLAERTMQQYRDLGNRPIIPTLGKVRLSKFTPAEADRWLARLDEATTRPRKDRAGKVIDPGHPIAQGTKRGAFAALSKCLNTAVRDGLIPVNPLTKVDRPQKTKTVVPVMTGTQVDTLLSALEDHHLQPLVTFVALTGCRLDEALRLVWSDVDLVKRTATLRGTKTDSSVRTVPLVPDVITTLEANRSAQLRLRIRLGAGWVDDDRVFRSRTGTRIDQHNARRGLRAVLAANGLPTERPFHTMRHSLATRLLNRGVPMPIVSQILGHSSIRTTVDVYGHAEPAITADVLNAALAR